MSKPRPWTRLTEDPKDPAYHYYNAGNNRDREQADKATTWAELPASYRDMVLSGLGDYNAYCRTRESVSVELFKGSCAMELARRVLEAAVPVRICPEHTRPVFKRDEAGVFRDTGKETRCAGSGKPQADDWYCPDGGCGRDMRKFAR